MDVTALAKDLALFMAPFLPYLTKAGESAVGEAGKKFGEQAWSHAQALWAKLRPKVEAKPATLDAVEKVVLRPDDARAKGALELQLEDILVNDAALATEIVTLLKEAKSSGNSAVIASNRSVAAGRDVSDSTIVTGDGNSVQRGKYNISIGKAKGTAIGDNARVDMDDDADDE